MEIYKVPENSRIKVIEEELNIKDELTLCELYDMYCLCTKDNGDTVYLNSWVNVEIVKIKEK